MAGVNPGKAVPPLQRGTSYLYRAPTGEQTRHLRFVATDPSTDPIVIVSISRWRSGCVDLIELSRDDHPWLEPHLVSVPKYEHFMLAPRAKLEEILLTPGTFHTHVVETKLLDRILTVALTNRRARSLVRPEVLAHLQLLQDKRSKAG